METKFNFKSAICTSRSQSERLLSLGLKKETADMYITSMSRKGLNYTDDWQIGSISYCDVMSFWDSKGLQLEKTAWSIIPAWSLHRLIEMMPKTIGRYFQYTSNDSCGYMDEDALNMNGGFDEGNIYDSIISCIEWLIKKGYFNKEYLV